MPSGDATAILWRSIEHQLNDHEITDTDADADEQGQ